MEEQRKPWEWTQEVYSHPKNLGLRAKLNIKKTEFKKRIFFPEIVSLSKWKEAFRLKICSIWIQHHCFIFRVDFFIRLKNIHVYSARIFDSISFSLKPMQPFWEKQGKRIIKFWILINIKGRFSVSLMKKENGFSQKNFELYFQKHLLFLNIWISSNFINEWIPDIGEEKIGLTQNK